ncbi:1-deoxy-D-xylulose-5-phosphate synthase [Verrucomicrobiota bacterium]
MSEVLERINSPSDLKKLNIGELTRLAEEVRALIIETVSKTGGHLAANLGTVELTIALLNVFDPPADKLIWDVSHQTYAYKILTGRRDAFPTLRQHDGLSGFLLKKESPYDAFGAGHAGTSLSAAMGMAVARDMREGDEHVVAVIGDGALGCGSSFEALNNLAFTSRRLIVVLNDNEMSISANVGSVSRYLGKLLAHPRYNRWKASVEDFAKRRLKLTWLRNAYFRAEEAVKSLFLHSVLFEEFGLRYIGPIDGHNIETLISALDIARHSDKPILLHVTTQKGRGYAFAEQEPAKWHGTGAFERGTGKLLDSGNGLKYSDVFGKTLERLAEKNEKIIAITAAMSVGTGLSSFAKRFPSRFFDVGISEEHAVVFAAGLACEGHVPVVVVYSTFAQRIVDYVIHDVCLQQLPVVFCFDRAGIVGDDGPTHHGVFDIALFRSVPNAVIMQPKDEAELAHMLYSAISWAKPVIIRYPRGCGPGTQIPGDLEELPYGKAEKLREGKEVQIWALGDMIPLAEKVADRLEPHGWRTGIVNPRFICPLDQELLKEQATTARVIVTIENGMKTGGFGSAITEQLSDLNYKGHVLPFGWPDQFIPQGAYTNLTERFGLTDSAIADAIVKKMEL